MKNSNLLYFFIALLAYYLSGQLGLQLAIPPGFASAVWPASGVALACVLSFNRVAAILGVSAGSFLLNLSLTTQGYNELNWQAAQPAMLIALGAGFQCLFGAYLFQRLLQSISLIDTPRDILRFSFLVAPYRLFAWCQRRSDYALFESYYYG